MALPALNNSNTIANLPMDANSISQAVLTAASRTGHLQIYNNGTIAFNNNISGGSAPSATRESGGLGYSGISLLSEIRNYLESINGNITRFIETSQRQTEITQNLLEATNAKRDIEVPRTAVQEKGMDFKQTFQDFFNSMKDSFSSIAGGMKGGLMGGMLGGLLKGVLTSIGGFLLRGFGAVFAGYLVAKGIGKIPIGGGKTIGDKVSELTESAYGAFERFVSSGGDTAGQEGNIDGGTSTAPGSSSDISVGAPSGTPTTTSPSGTDSSATPSTDSRQPTRTSTPVKSIPRPKRDSGGSISGLNFSHPEQKAINDQIAGITLELQKRLGKKFLIVSGYRSKEYTKKLLKRGVHTSMNSPHTRGTAVDLEWEGGRRLSNQDFLKIIPIASSLGVGGIGVYPNAWIHLDVEKRRAWGPAVSKGSSSGPVPKFAKEVIAKHLRNEYAGGYILEEENKPTPTKEKELAGEHVPEKSTGIQTEGEKSEGEISSTQSPSSTDTAAPQKKPTSDRIPSGSVGGGEEEEEQEETSEKVLTDPSLDKKTATKAKNRNPNKYPEDIERLFVTVEEKYKLPKGLLRAIAETETGPIGPKNTFEQKSKKVSNKGAKGLMQFMPGTAKQEGLSNPFNPKASIVAAGHYFGVSIPRELKTDDPNIIKNPKILAAAYNAGSGNVRKAGYKVPNFTETKNYVTKVAGYMSTGVSDTTIAAEQPSTTGGAARPSSGQQPTGDSAQQEPQTFEDKAKEVGEAVTETAEEAWEWTKEKFEQIKKDFGPDRNMLNKVLSAGINEIYDIAGIDPRKRVKIEDGKVVPYTKDTATQQPTEGQGAVPAQATTETASQSTEGRGALATLLDSSGVTKTGEAIYTSSVGVKTGEQQLIQGKVDSAPQPTIINNVPPQTRQKGDNPNGVMGAVPPVRQKIDSTLEEAQYRNIRGTGIV